MTFKAIAQDIAYGYLVSEQEAQARAVEEILEGFMDLEEARACADTMIETGNVYFTGWGYEVDSHTLCEAIRRRERKQ